MHSSRKFIPKIEKTIDPGPPGWFFIENDKGEREVFMRVPQVDGLGRLMLHSIAGHGGVEPSVLITGLSPDGVTKGEYHEFVSLSDWPSGIYKKAGDQFIPPDMKETPDLDRNI